jgi:DNA-binding NtrC family response regulator
MMEPGEPAAAVILVVEDEALVRMVVSDVLADAGYRVIDAVSADEALRLLGLRSDVRALVTDVRMPGKLDGLALARIVAERWPEVGILVSSGDTRPAPGDLPPGAQYVPKPCPSSALIGAVRTLLEETSASTDEVPAVGAAPVLPVSEVATVPGQAAPGGGLAQPLARADE